MTSNKPQPDIASALRDLLETGDANTHEEICAALERQGYQANQSKISRLLHKLGAIKITDSNGRGGYRLPHDYKLSHELSNTNKQSSISQMITGVTASDTLVVLHTNPGAASLVARIIDQERKELKILGCIAGDDTIFVAPKSSADLPVILDKIRRLFAI